MMKELIEYIQAYYPWLNKDQARSHLVMETPWPLVRGEESIKAYIRTRVINNWDKYVEYASKKGFEVTEPPNAKILSPPTMILYNTMAVPNYFKK